MSTVPASSSVRGTKLGRYELVCEIASGGMATVYIGRTIGVKGFSRVVAIKKLHAHLERDEEFVAMFLDEARLAARIRHPNVVATLDVDDRDGLYIVMDYVEGDRLLGLLRGAAKSGTRIPTPIALRIATEALAGLHAAHELTDDDGAPIRLVHRDVSPQNVLIGIDGITKITDFGIAKAESRLTTTRDGQLKGKIAYMAPEQTRGGEIDRRVDVFATGILAWEMLAGARLFRGDNDAEILHSVVYSPIPRLRDAAPDTSPALERVVMRALERDPNARWNTAAEFAEAIEEAAARSGQIATTRDVAQYVQTVAAVKIAEERARLRSGATEPPRTTRTSSLPPNPLVTETSGIGVRAAATTADVSAPPTAVPHPPTPRRRMAVASIVAIVVLGTAVVGAWRMRPHRAARPEASAQALPTPMQPMSTPEVAAVVPPSVHATTLVAPIVPVAIPSADASVARPEVEARTRRAATPAVRAAPRSRTNTPPARNNDDDTPIGRNPYLH